MALISAIMAMGVNMQWGYAGLFNTGVMGFVALGGLAVVITSAAPVPEGWAAGGPRLLARLADRRGHDRRCDLPLSSAMAPGARARAGVDRRAGPGCRRCSAAIIDPAVTAVEAFNPATAGNLGGLGLPILIAWPVGGLLAAGAAWAIGKMALGLRSDYLAIATLGIAEIILAVLKNEDWLARGVKNITRCRGPCPTRSICSRMRASSISPRAGASIR